ncbi:hypothetical protein MHBO_003608 [Bonamia ostreae]|uniref:Bax inhibitor 1 n=1 Tax=Bonamia ostreae TaxID=126728 RepID=A0ABV2ARL3_9EUKA
MSFFQTAQNTDYRKAFALSDLSKGTQEHLSRVYGLLSFATTLTALTTLFCMRSSMSESLMAVATITVFLSFFAFVFASPENQKLKIALFLVISAAKGAILAPLLNLAVSIDPAIVVTALVGTVSIFLCFSISALYAKRRQYLFLGAILGAGMLILSVLALANVFIRSESLLSLELYGGLMMFCLYVLYDTQLIIFKAEMGDRDVAGHAMALFTDLFAIFVRLLIILMRRNESKERKRRNE